MTSRWYESATRRRVAVSTHTRYPVLCAVGLRRVQLLFQNPLCRHVLPEVTVVSCPCFTSRTSHQFDTATDSEVRCQLAPCARVLVDRRVPDNTAELCSVSNSCATPGFPPQPCLHTIGVLVFFVCALVWSIETRC